jgi:AraC-like DNA-binding protein
MPVPALTRSASLTNFADVATRVGLDAYRLLSEFGLPQRCVSDPDLKVPIDTVRALLEAAAERSGAEAFGLLMAETRQLSNLGPAGLLIREQPTVRLAIEALLRYSRKLNSALLLTLEESADVVVLREEIVVGHGGSVRQSTELAIGVAFRTLQTLLGPRWKPRRVCFAHDAPADRSVHERVFGRNVEFGHDFNGIVCARADLAVPNPNADPGMARYAAQMLDATLARDSAIMSAQVRDLIVALLGTGHCTIDVVAQHMGVDRRTVHRRLQAEAQTFSTLVDDVRRELATRYMAQGDRRLSEVSSLLGFSAPSSFSRWYRREFKGKASLQRGTVTRRN